MSSTSVFVMYSSSLPQQANEDEVRFLVLLEQELEGAVPSVRVRGVRVRVGVPVGTAA